MGEISPDHPRVQKGTPGAEQRVPGWFRSRVSQRGWEVVMLILEQERNKAELFWLVAPGKERKSLKLIFFKWEGMKSVGEKNNCS